MARKPKKKRYYAGGEIRWLSERQLQNLKDKHKKKIKKRKKK